MVKPYATITKNKASEEELSKRLVLTLMGIVSLIFVVVISIAFFAPKIGSFFGLFSIHRNDTDAPPAIKPSTPILSNMPDSVKNNNVNINGFGQAGMTIKLFVNGPIVAQTVVSADGAFNFNDVPLLQGTNSVFAKEYDNLGNESEKTVTYMVNVDNKGPKIELTNIKDGDIVKNLDKRIIIDGTVDEKATIKINDKFAILRPDLSFEYLLGVNEGKVTIKVEAQDDAGNTTVKETTVTYKKSSN